MMVKTMAARPKSGFTPLMHAALIGNVPALRSLLAAGADPFLRDSDGHTARDWAASKLHGGPFPFATEVLEEAEEKWSGERPAASPGGGAKVSSEL